MTSNEVIWNIFLENHIPGPREGGADMEFQRLTILTFLQSSVVQSLALSHRDIQPVTQFEGLQVGKSNNHL